MTTVALARPGLPRLAAVELRKSADTRAGFWLLLVIVLLAGSQPASADGPGKPAATKLPYPYVYGKAFHILPKTHQGSGYFSLCEGLDGRVYVGTAKYGEKNPDPYAIYGYEAMSLFLDTCKELGADCTDRQKVIDRYAAAIATLPAVTRGRGSGRRGSCSDRSSSLR